jgi:hypothetical protein
VSVAVGLDQARWECRVSKQRALRFTRKPTLTSFEAPSGTQSAFAIYRARWADWRGRRLSEECTFRAT